VLYPFNKLTGTAREGPMLDHYTTGAKPFKKRFPKISDKPFKKRFPKLPKFLK